MPLAKFEFFNVTLRIMEICEGQQASSSTFDGLMTCRKRFYSAWKKATATADRVETRDYHVTTNTVGQKCFFDCRDLCLAIFMWMISDDLAIQHLAARPRNLQAVGASLFVACRWSFSA